MQKYKKIIIIAVVVLSALAITLNHASVQFGKYNSESEQQSESVDRGRLSVIGPFVFSVDFDGSVVPPSGFANDVRTFVIDFIITGQAIALIAFAKSRRC